MATGNLFAQQEANKKASLRLLVGFGVFIGWLGFGGDYIMYLHTKNVRAERIAEGLSSSEVWVIPWIGIFLSILAVGACFWALKNGARALMDSMEGIPLNVAKTAQEKVLLNVVEEMSIAAGIRKPQVWLIPEKAPNAFATGTSIGESHIGVTTGLLDSLDRDELQAVVGHEMGHIVNLDVRLMTLLTSLVGFIAIINQAGGRMMRGGVRGGMSRGGKGFGRKGAGLVVILLIIWIISWILAPLVAKFVVMKVGRTREYLADSMSAQFTRNPGALATALAKISGSDEVPLFLPESSAHLFISDPFHSKWDQKTGWKANLMGTHPPTRDRIDRLNAMALGRPVMCMDGRIRKVNDNSDLA